MSACFPGIAQLRHADHAKQNCSGETGPLYYHARNACEMLHKGLVLRAEGLYVAIAVFCVYYLQYAHDIVDIGF